MGHVISTPRYVMNAINNIQLIPEILKILVKNNHTNDFDHM